MKNILAALLLFSASVFASAPFIQRITSEQLGEGYMIHFVKDGVVYCWGLPDVIDLAFIPTTWMAVQEAAITFNWPVMVGEAATACANGPKVYRTAGGPLWQVSPIWQTPLTLKQNGTVPAGLACGEQVSNYVFMRAVIYNNNRGFAACF